MQRRNSTITITISILIFCIQPAVGDTRPLQMIELTGEVDSDPGLASSIDSESREKSEQRLEHLEGIAQNRRDMDTYGFIIVPEETARLSENLYRDILDYQETNPDVGDVVSLWLAYPAIDVQLVAGSSGALVGMLPVLDDDQSIHHMFYAFEFDGLGPLVIEELSFATSTDGTIRVTEPSGNVKINGISGTYIVAVNSRETESTSSLDFWTSTRKFTLTTPTRIELGTARFDKLLAIAETL